MCKPELSNSPKPPNITESTTIQQLHSVKSMFTMIFEVIILPTTEIDFACIVSRWLERRKMTKTKLAKRMGISRQALHNLMNGTTRWHEDHIRSAAEALGFSISDNES
jgi:predicted DNA-binding protein (UPF0251 family)